MALLTRVLCFVENIMNWQHFYHLVLEPQYLAWLWQGFLLTLLISFCTIITSTILGLVVAALRDSPSRWLSWPAACYSAFFRNTPLLVQLFFWYFGTGQLLPTSWMEWFNTSHDLVISSVTLSWPSFEFLAGLLGLTLYSTAFVAEEIRSGIRGVAQGQKYAATALGMNTWQSMRFVIFPQAVRIAFPPLLGQYMNIVKNSSLTMAIGVAELSYQSRQVETETLRTFQSFAVATLLYILVIAVMEGWGMWRQQRNTVGVMH